VLSSWATAWLKNPNSGKAFTARKTQRRLVQHEMSALNRNSCADPVDTRNRVLGIETVYQDH
jgi:hypothetical protein